MFKYKDQIGSEVLAKDVPKRIISLVPSQTEFLFDLGLDEEIVGITKFCIHPKEKIKAVPKIGGTKNFNFNKIHSLNPDLIIGNKEENYKEGIEQLKINYPVWMSDIATLEDAFVMMDSVGEIVGKSSKAEQIVKKISNDFDALNIQPKKEALYLIWKNPYMSIGGDTFISHMMEYAGFKNILGIFSRYPVITEEEIKAMQPEYILLSSEPFPFKEKHISEFNYISPKSKIIIVDGEMFSWFGSRLQFASQYLNQLSSI